MNSKVLLSSLLLLSVSSLPAVRGATLADYDVVWTTESANAAGSMPCGGGDVGLNVWVEKGELLFYVARSGTFDELNGMPKLGRIRLLATPNPFTGADFRQTLHLADGSVEVSGTIDGVPAKARLWVDVFQPVVHVEVSSGSELSLEVRYESWRWEDQEQVRAVMESNRTYLDAPVPAIRRRDQISFSKGGVRFMHRNEGTNAFDLTVEQQGLAKVKDRLWDPLSQLTFGGELYATGLEPAGVREGLYASTPFKAWCLKSASPARHFSFVVALHTAQVPAVGTWEKGLEDLLAASSTGNDVALQKNSAWWSAFWDRSHVFVGPNSAPDLPQWQVGRNYQLFRYQLACNANGSSPTKFNGGLFTFDPEFIKPERRFSPDYRAWGGGTFTAQNQRLLYWPLLKSGDFDVMTPQFEFYRRALGNAELRSEIYWGIKGASFTEQMETYGLPVAFEYGWKRRADAEPGVEDNPWLNHYWDTSLEFCQMILERQRYSGEDLRRYVPLVQSCVSFFQEYYCRAERLRTGKPYDEKGNLVLFPSTALETYKDARNPINLLSGLRVVLSSLLALPEGQLTAAERARWTDLLARIPALPRREREGHLMLSPAESWSHIQNIELPHLYPVYPWGLYGIGRPDLQLARDTWHYGIDVPDQSLIVSWHQNAIFCARLALTDEAAELTLKKMTDSERRFPTWWGPGHDWVPDHNWGGSGMIGVQEMLLQEVGDSLYLLPAWPRSWDVDFKLHASQQTVVECRVRGGVLISTKVTPASRAANLVLPDWAGGPPLK